MERRLRTTTLTLSWLMLLAQAPALVGGLSKGPVEEECIAGDHLQFPNYDWEATLLSKRIWKRAKELAFSDTSKEAM